MLRVRVGLDGEGCLRTVEAAGHAETGKSGEDLACAAASGLLRSVARLLYNTEGVAVEGGAAEPGRLSLVVVRRPAGSAGWLRGVTEVLLTGLRDLGVEQPGSIELKIGEEGKEEH